MKILVTGGNGYIGSHCVVELINNGHQVVIFDNLSNSTKDVVERIEQISGTKPDFVLGDVRDSAALDQVFSQHQFDAVIHFAALKAVGESVELPLEYYENNVVGSLNLLQAMRQHQVFNLIFSSSATVYSSADRAPYVETMSIAKGTNPYGNSKIIVEQVLADLAIAQPQWSIKALRYFNPIGAHSSGLIGENPTDIPNNLLPYLTKVAIGELKQLSVFGSDYPTKDGSCIRDYIHVSDLASGHLCALNYQAPGYHIFNLGLGQGTSVLEIIQQFEQVCAVSVPYQIVGRRAGDLAEVWSNPQKSIQQLGWQAKYDLSDMLRSAWQWQQNSKSKN